MNKSLSSFMAVALAVAVGACGDSANDEQANTAAPPPAPAGTQVADTSQPPALEPFLMRDGEQPGFKRVDHAQTYTNLDDFLAGGPPMRPADEQLLRSSRQLSTIFQPTSGPKTAGVTSVTLFATADGARQWIERERSEDYIHTQLPDAKVNYFDVPGIPGARGWKASDPHGEVGNVIWLQGRCMMILGNQGPGPIAEPLSTGARAVYKRTAGACPQ